MSNAWGINFCAVQGMKWHVECIRNEFMCCTKYDIAGRMHQEWIYVQYQGWNCMWNAWGMNLCAVQGMKWHVECMRNELMCSREYKGACKLH